MRIKELSKEYEQYILEMRREFHMYPELSLQEERTSKRIQEELNKMGIGYEVIEKNVIGRIKGTEPGKRIALRADFDALPIQEENDLPYRSKNDGVMHACGHDANTAMLLGAAKILNEIRDEIKGEVLLCFQMAEEVAKGHESVLEYFEKIGGIDNIMGIHLWGIQTGKISVNEGPRMASVDGFTIKVKGKGGHGSQPDKCIDPIKPAAQILLNISAIPTNEYSALEPVVVHPCMFNAGDALNIFPEEAIIKGAFRTFSRDARVEIPLIIKRIAENTARSYGAEAEVSIMTGITAAINHPESSRLAEKTVEKLFGKDTLENVPQVAGSDNFGEYSERYPSVYAWVGAANEEKGANFALHNPKFILDEDGLKDGAALLAQYAVDFISE